MLGNADRQLDSQPSALGQQQHVKALVADEQLPPQVVTEPCNLPPFHLFQPLVTRQPPPPTLRPESFHFHDLFHRTQHFVSGWRGVVHSQIRYTDFKSSKKSLDFFLNFSWIF